MRRFPPNYWDLELELSEAVIIGMFPVSNLLLIHFSGRRISTYGWQVGVGMAAEALHRLGAGSCCDMCGEPEPITRESGKAPQWRKYCLRLIFGGSDSIDNAEISGQ